MTIVFELDEIKDAVRTPEVITANEEGFVMYSQGKVVVPPVGHLNFEDPPGDVHIKYGYIKGDDFFVIKIAYGFYDNPALGLPASDGSMLVYRQQTGELVAILFDKGYLTELRTGAAGAIAAKYLAPKNVERIGIVGAGVQARFQLSVLKEVIDCRDVLVWGRDQKKLDVYREEMEALGFDVQTTLDRADVAATCNLIVTVTPAREPLLMADQIRAGTHITAVGSDSVGKQELDAAILQKADRVVADSISQCVDHGECAHGVQADFIKESEIVEMGSMIADSKHQRASDDEITVADLTGVAIQDIQIAKMAYQALAG